MLSLVCIAPDGDYRVEFDNFDYDNVDEVRQHSANMGTRYYFYPVRVIADSDTHIIEDAPEAFAFLIGKNYCELRSSTIYDKFLATCELLYDYGR